MFFGNRFCDFYSKTTEADAFGRYTYAAKQRVKVTVVSLDIISQKSSVRADTSGSRGQAEQLEGTSVILFAKSAGVNIGDVVYIDGYWLEAIEVVPRYSVIGKLDHKQVQFKKREAI